MKSKRELNIFQRFFRTEVFSGFILLAAAVLALALANSDWADGYHHIWARTLSIGGSNRGFTLTWHQWINDGLMALFFLLVGIEIKRELLVGELSSAKKAALPIAGAIGGMVLPALLYFGFNPTGAAARGWGIPMATDIAFALGALSLVAPRAPTSVRIFLAALAIVDDMGAVLVIALFYTSDLAFGMLGAAGLTTLGLIVLNAIGVKKPWPYLVLGIILWYFVHESGVHATIAGVALAMTLPIRARTNSTEFTSEARASATVAAPFATFEHALHRFSAFVVMPIFAFANAGVQIGGPLSHREIALGILAGLLIGKPLGITAVSWLAIKLGVAEIPRGMSWRLLHGAAWLGGIGFTMSLFITMLAFNDLPSIDTAKQAILGGSLLAGLVATVVLRKSQRF